MKIRYIFLLLLAVVTPGMVAAKISLIESGVSRCIIVLPENPVKAEEFAVEELQYHIEKSTGVKLEVCGENDIPPGKLRIYIGNCRAARDAGIDTASLEPSEYRVKTAGNDLFLAGKDRFRSGPGSHWSADWQGTLFAVYDFLENDLKVRWLWPGTLGEVIPRRTDFVIGAIDRSGKPFFEYSMLRVRKPAKEWMNGWSSVENRDAFYRDQSLFLLRQRVSATRNMAYGHGFTDYWSKYGKDHPEYFALRPDGKREPLEGDKTGKYIALCVSQEALIKRIVANWRQSRERNPDNIPYRPYLNACENDIPGMCVCEQCRAWDYPDPAFEKSPYWSPLNKTAPTIRTRFQALAKADWGEGTEREKYDPPSVTERYARFYLELLQRARKIDPSAKVVAYAYANYTKPPRDMRMDKDIIINFVPNMFFPYTREHSREFQEKWLAWRQSGVEHLYYRPNYMLAGANMPISLAEQIHRDFSFAARNGAIACDFDSLNGAWSTQGPTLYLLSRMQWNPNLAYEDIMNEYYSGFGKAAGQVQAYFEYWKGHSDSIDEETFLRYSSEERAKDGRPGGSFMNFVLVSARLFPDAAFDKGFQLLKAAGQAATGEPESLRRVEFLEKGLRDAYLTSRVRIAQKQMQDKPSAENRKEFTNAFQAMKQYRESIEKDNVCNYTHMVHWESYGANWPWQRIKLPQ